MTTNNAPNEGGEDLCQALLLLTLSPQQWWALPDQLTLNWLESQALIDRQPQRMRCRACWSVLFDTAPAGRYS